MVSERSELLVKSGFIQKKFQEFYEFNKEKNQFVKVDGSSINGSHAEEEVYEEFKDAFMETGFPEPEKRFRLTWEVYDLSIEETYFWILKYLQYDIGFPIVNKLEDTLSAAENSAIFGMSQQRLGIQQDKVSSFLATMGKMIKELFQMVRELRIIDEKKAYYEGAEGGEKSSEITLKGMFIDLVQGGAKNPASVYGMARELEFTSLPDIFFDAPPFKSVDLLEEYVNKLEFNLKLKEVLKRHLRQFFEWKKRTFEEILTRRKFMLQYLRQHFDIIKMYMEWVKPYLRYVKRLTMKKKHIESPDIVSAFEGSVVDVELLAVKPFGKYHSCILATFNYRTSPQMKFQQEGYRHLGPIHVGRMDLSLRGYIWTENQIDNYKRLKVLEDFELLGDVTGGVKAAMDALGDELIGYLEEAGEQTRKKEPKAEKKTLMQQLFGDFFGGKKVKSAKPVKPKKLGDDGSKEKAVAHNDLHLWNTYNNFKKAHQLINW